MSMLFQEIIDELEAAKKAATMENASFGFPEDRIRIERVHSNGERGRAGDIMHPDEYIKRITKLHHQSWIVSRIDRVIGVLKLHEKALHDAEDLVEALEGAEEIAEQLRSLAHRLI